MTSKCTSEGLASTKSTRIQQLQNDPTQPESYTKKCGVKVDEFSSNFSKEQPDLKNRVAYLKPPNEYNVKKFACTTIQPTLLPQKELYDLRQCAEFISRFIKYEPLESDSAEPVIVTPTQTLKWGVGDAFDISVLLASFLIGAGYDANVVIGSAPSYIRLKDMSEMTCSLTNRDTNTDPFKPWSVDVDIKDNCSRMNEGLTGLHYWLFVRPSSKREMDMPCFVEPSTGIIYPLDKSPYTETWCAFNERNFWINNTNKFITSDFSSWLRVLPSDAPFSYVSRLEIPSTQFALRYPPLGRTYLLVDKTKIEYFGDSVDSQGVATRISQFDDKERTVVVQITELFSPNTRSDGLIERIRRPQDMSCYEKYSVKNPHSIQERFETASSHDIKFFQPNNRPDGLFQRVEIIGLSIDEKFHDRSDSLVRRMVTLNRLPRDTKRPKQTEAITCDGLGFAEMSRIDCQYDAPTDKSLLEKCPASISFELKEKRIVVCYHCHHEALKTRDVYMKEDILESESDLKERELLKLESSSILSLKKIHDEVTEMRDAAHQYDLQLSDNTMKIGGIDTVPIKTVEEKDIVLGSEKTYDYLSPFLAQLDNPNNPLTKEEAIQVREACLKNLKERLMDRASIISSRLNDARGLLVQKQEALNNDQTAPEDLRALELAVTDDTFRIKVMEKRLSEHEEMAIERYKALEMKLNEDDRLISLR
eukprot:scaffold49757_cov82-Cyclotella_meneghiniana.AAC.2